MILSYILFPVSFYILSILFGIATVGIINQPVNMISGVCGLGNQTTTANACILSLDNVNSMCYLSPLMILGPCFLAGLIALVPIGFIAAMTVFTRLRVKDCIEKQKQRFSEQPH